MAYFSWKLLKLINTKNQFYRHYQTNIFWSWSSSQLKFSITQPVFPYVHKLSEIAMNSITHPVEWYRYTFPNYIGDITVAKAPPILPQILPFQTVCFTQKYICLSIHHINTNVHKFPSFSAFLSHTHSPSLRWFLGRF